MILWWKYQQLRSSNPTTRLTTVSELAQSKSADAVGPLLFALKDENMDIRCAAVRALGCFPDEAVIEALGQLLRDPETLVRTTVAEVLGQFKDPGATTPLVDLLHDSDTTVRVRASNSLDRLGWWPKTEEERTWQMVAKGNLERVVELGSEGVKLLAELMRSGTPAEQLSAVKALGEIRDPRALKLVIEALKKNQPLVRQAALEILERIGDPATYPAVEPLLADQEPHVRAAAIATAINCDNHRAVPKLVGMLRDVSWEVRREVITALGKLGDANAVDGLTMALQDRDHDVRDSAAVALGRIGDPRAIGPLVLALLDIESFVRNAAHTALNEIDPHWQNTEAARRALPQIKAAQKHREYWISHSATSLLEQIPEQPAAGSLEKSPAATVPVQAPPPPAPTTPPPAVFDILKDLLTDNDRDLRLAAVAAFGQLREPRAATLLAAAIHDDDLFVRQAAERALVVLN